MAPSTCRRENSLSLAELAEIKSTTIDEDWIVIDKVSKRQTITKQVYEGGFWKAGRNKWMQCPIESQLISWAEMDEDATEWFFYGAQLLVRIGEFAIGSKFHCVSIDTTQSSITLYHTAKDFKSKVGMKYSLVLTVGERL